MHTYTEPYTFPSGRKVMSLQRKKERKKERKKKLTYENNGHLGFPVTRLPKPTLVPKLKFEKQANKKVTIEDSDHAMAAMAWPWRREEDVIAFITYSSASLCIRLAICLHVLGKCSLV